MQLFIHARYSEYTKNFSFEVYPTDMSAYGYIHLETRELTFSPPPLTNLIFLQTQQLKDKLEKVRADAQVEVTKIEEALQKLLCLEHKEAV